MHNFQEFIDYVYSFYGPAGLYDQKRTKEQIALATLLYLDACDDQMTWGDGDSLDRERVRDYMNDMYGQTCTGTVEEVSPVKLAWACCDL